MWNNHKCSFLALIKNVFALKFFFCQHCNIKKPNIQADVYEVGKKEEKNVKNLFRNIYTTYAGIATVFDAIKFHWDTKLVKLWFFFGWLPKNMFHKKKTIKLTRRETFRKKEIKKFFFCNNPWGRLRLKTIFACDRWK